MRKNLKRASKIEWTQKPSHIFDDDPINALKLPLRLENALKRAGIKTIGEFFISSEERLSKIRNIGPKALNFFSRVRAEKRDKIISTLGAPTNPYSFDDYCLPPQLSANDPIEVLELPTRLENALKRYEYKTVNCLLQSSEKELFRVRNLGVKSVKFLMLVKEKIRNRAIPISDSPMSVVDQPKRLEPEIPNNKLIDYLLDRCKNERLIEIISRRYGLTSGEKDTLEEIGKSFRVTRERIRQLQLKALKKMRHPNTKAKKPIIRLIEKALWGKGGIISSEEGNKLIPKIFENKKHNGNLILNLLADLNWIQKYLIGDVELYSPQTDMPELAKISKEVTDVLKRQKTGKSARFLAGQIPSLKGVSNDNFRPIVFVKRYCLLDPRVLKATDTFGYKPPVATFIYYSQYRWTNVWVSRIKQILEREQAPLHFTEIANKVNDSLASREHHLEMRRAHAVLIENRQFAHTGIRGTYGLTKWGIRKESTPELVAECLKKAGFPVHWEQIYHYVSKYKDSPPGNIRSVLEFNKKFESKGNGMYWLRGKKPS